MIKKIYCVCVRLKKNVMRTGLFTRHFANGRYAISIIATYYIEMKNVFPALEIAERPSGKFQGINQSQIFDHIVSVVLR